MLSTTATQPRVAKQASLLRDAVRAGRSRTSVRQYDPYVAQLAKELLSRETDQRRRAFEQIVAVVDDMAARGAVGDAENIGFLLVAIARDAALRAGFLTRPARSIADAHASEQAAEGAVNERETAMSHNPTVSNWLAYLVDRAGHRRAIDDLDVAVRAAVVRAACEDRNDEALTTRERGQGQNGKATSNYRRPEDI